MMIFKIRGEASGLGATWRLARGSPRGAFLVPPVLRCARTAGRRLCAPACLCLAVRGPRGGGALPRRTLRNRVCEVASRLGLRWALDTCLGPSLAPFGGLFFALVCLRVSVHLFRHCLHYALSLILGSVTVSPLSFLKGVDIISTW